MFDGRVIEVDVQELLNGVDLEGTRKRPPTSEKEGSALRLFYSYSHEDEGLRDRLEIQLKLLQRRKFIATWHDRKIEPGEDWRRRSTRTWSGLTSSCCS